MNAELRASKTPAELALAEAFAASRGRLPGALALREAGFRRFADEGLPNRRVEQWKYTDLRAAIREALPLASAPGAAARATAAKAGGLPADMEVRRIVFADGAFLGELSDLDRLEKGLTVRPMSAALSAGDPLAAAHLGRIAGGDQVTALNAALMTDGVLIHVAEGATLERPLHLVFALSDTPVSVFTRSLAVIEKGARAMLVETHEGGSAHQVNTALELSVGNHAHVDHIKITGGGDSVVHVSSLMAEIGAHARFNEFVFTTGGGVVRNQMFLTFAGEEALAGVRGASLLGGRQHADTTMVADHAGRGSQTRQVFKSVLDGQSRGVFQGKIIVRPGAQKTDAKMMTQSLLLSEEAEANHKPELEIFADDVQCGHGATSGSLDEGLKFYLMARGIPEPEAEALLVQAFVGEAVEGIEHAGLRDALMQRVADWLQVRGGVR